MIWFLEFSLTRTITSEDITSGKESNYVLICGTKSLELLDLLNSPDADVPCIEDPPLCQNRKGVFAYVDKYIELDQRFSIYMQYDNILNGLAVFEDEADIKTMVHLY